MPALATLTLVWLGTQKPDASAAAALERWAHEHAFELADARSTPNAATAPSMLNETCEGWLEQARDQLQAGDDEAAQGKLAQLDQTLRQHPELLQAGWLMAERYRLEARLARRSSTERAATLERLAEVTEGARAAAFGEPSHGARAAVPDVHIELAVHGARRHESYWDGSPSGDDFSTPPGEHHLLLFRGARVAWAGWVSALATGKIDVWVPDAPACSVEDFEGVTLDGAARIVVPPGIRCAAWVAAASGSRAGEVSIAVCDGDHCPPSATWTDQLASAPAPDERAPAKSALPAWAAWTLVGVGVAAATSIVLWRTGVFDTAHESKVYYDGGNL